MIHRIRTAAAAWRADRRGGVAAIFGITFIPIMIVSGAAIDYSRAAAQWSNLQQATDATALWAAHTYLTASSTSATLKQYAQDYISGLMNGATVNAVTLTQNTTQVCVSSSFTVPAIFMRIARINSLPVSTIACSQVGHTYEVALALDNSGSMQESAGSQSKIQALQAAAKQLVGILIPSGTTAPQVGISVVPFTTLVNVAGSVDMTASNPSVPSFVDTAGASSIHWQNFHRPTGGNTWTPTSKLDLFKGMSTPWAGCVEELPPPYSATDQAPSSAADAKFVPYLAPDEPGDYDNTGSGYECFPNGNCQNSYIFGNSYLSDNGSGTTIGVCGNSTAYATADNATNGSGSAANVYPGAGATMVCKYKNTTPRQFVNPYYGSLLDATVGPNWLCNAQQLTPLTTSTSTLNGAINSMTAQGSTNLAAGFMWAWRTISPTVNPFPTSSTALIGPQNPKSYGYGPPPNTKVIILMTDGTNTWLNQPYSPWQSDYENFGYYVNNRMGAYLTPPSSIPGATTCTGGSTTNANNARCLMDNMTLDACNNAKNTHVIVYTIGFSVPSDPIDAEGQRILQTCATAPYSSHYFLASDSTGIQTAFQQIAASILSLRLSQ